MAKQKAELATTQDEDREASALAELSDFFDNVTMDGMSDVEGDDLKLAAKLWNMKGLDKNGKAYAKDVFFDTISETVSESIECVLLLTQKSNRWDEYDNDQKKTVVHCASQDRKLGLLTATGARRPCLGCPDAGWFRDPEGKPYRRCGPVHTVVAVERGTQRPFLIRFKKTALKPFRNYIMAHHWGARVGDGMRKNIPLFAYSASITLENHPSGNYALPVLNRGPMLSKVEMQSMHANAKSYMEIMGQVVELADATEATHDTAVEKDSGLQSADFVDA